MDAELIEAIESAVRTRDIGLLATYIIVSIIVALFLTLIARFRVSTEIKQLNQNFETLKEQQVELRRATGEIEQTLDRQSAMFKLRSAAYIEKSISAISAVYDSLLKVRNAALNVAYEDVAKHAPEFRAHVQTFRSELDIQKIWIPNKLATYIDKVAADMSNRATEFIIAEGRLARVEQLHDNQINSAVDAQEEFYDFIQNELPRLFEDVVERISKEVSPEASN